MFVYVVVVVKKSLSLCVYTVSKNNLPQALEEGNEEVCFSTFLSTMPTTEMK